MASAVFFLGGRLVFFHRPQLADPFVDLQQLIAQIPETLAFSDLALRLGQTGRGGERLGDGLAIHLACQPIVGAVAGVSGPMTMTVRISATSTGSRYRARPHVAQLGDLQLNGGAPGFQFSERVGHVQSPVT